MRRMRRARGDEGRLCLSRRFITVALSSDPRQGTIDIFAEIIIFALEAIRKQLSSISYVFILITKD